MNIEDKRNKWMVLAFGIFYTTGALIILNLIPQNTAFTIGLNGIGAVILTTIFWNKFIGKDTKFRPKPIWIPLIISLVVTIPFVLALIYG
jgi:hypothetical protein